MYKLVCLSVIAYGINISQLKDTILSQSKTGVSTPSLPVFNCGSTHFCLMLHDLARLLDHLGPDPGQVRQQ